MRKIWDNESGELHGHHMDTDILRKTGLERGVVKAGRTNTIVKTSEFCLWFWGGKKKKKSNPCGEDFSFIWEKTLAVSLLLVQDTNG